MTLKLKNGSLPYVATCDNPDCNKSIEVCGATLQYAREDLVQTHKWQMKGNPSTPSEPLNFCKECKDL